MEVGNTTMCHQLTGFSSILCSGQAYTDVAHRWERNQVVHEPSPLEGNGLAFYLEPGFATWTCYSGSAVEPGIQTDEWDQLVC